MFKTHLKSISSTFIEFMSTTNILNSTVTGVPFLEIGRISGKKEKKSIIRKWKTNNFLFYLYVMQYGVMQRSKSMAI